MPDFFELTDPVDFSEAAPTSSPQDYPFMQALNPEQRQAVMQPYG